MKACFSVLTGVLALAAAGCASTQPAAVGSVSPPQAPSADDLRPATQWDTNEAAREIIRVNEALRLEAYPEGEGWLIGYGHKMEAGEPTIITEEEAERLLGVDLQECETTLEAALVAPVTENEFSALASLCYNIGITAVRNSSAVRLLNEGRRQEAADAILLWNKAGGTVLANLERRREKERTLFLTREGFAVAATR